MISKIFNFVSTILVSAILITIYDRLVQPVVMVMSEEYRRGLRDNDNNDNNSVSESKALPNPSFAIVEEVTRTKASCSKFNKDEISCNSNTDEHGNACRYCVDHESINRVCVSDVSIEYRFAPCNNWICHVSDEPDKSDVTACERI